jgi:hypothetical protein
MFSAHIAASMYSWYASCTFLTGVQQEVARPTARVDAQDVFNTCSNIHVFTTFIRYVPNPRATRSCTPYDRPANPPPGGELCRSEHDQKGPALSEWLETLAPGQTNKPPASAGASFSPIHKVHRSPPDGGGLSTCWPTSIPDPKAKAACSPRPAWTDGPVRPAGPCVRGASGGRTRSRPA